jgi:HlyD family secretion protein
MLRVTLSILLAAACVAGGILIQRFLLTSSADRDNAPRTREKQDTHTRMSGTIAALGRLEPEGEVLDIGAGSGTPDRLDRLLVKEGQYVTEGQELAYLESHTLRLAERDHIASRLAEARAQLAATTAYGTALVHEAQLARETLDLVQPLEIKVQEANVRLHEIEYAHARKEVKRLSELRLSEASTQQELDKEILAGGRCRESLASAQALLDKLRLTYQQDVAKAKAQFATALAALARNQNALPVGSLEKELDLANTRVQLALIRAPCAGEVLKIRTHPGEAVGAKPILRMGQTASMVALAEVYHTDVRFLKVGQKATLTSPALPEPLRGTIVQIGALIAKNDVLGVDPTADVDARVVEVRIRLEPSEIASRMTFLQVNILIETAEEGDK